jgi:hypothetical protein
MLRFTLGVFVVLHGLVHLLYFGQSRRLFELQPGMAWPADSWAFARLLGADAVRWLAGAACILAAALFIGGGLGIFVRQAWWRPVIVASAVFSAVLFILFWNGGFQKLDNQGGIGILINLAILGAVLVLQWPQFEA